LVPKPNRELTEKQYEFLVEKLDKPAPPEMQARLRQAIKNAKNMKVVS